MTKTPERPNTFTEDLKNLTGDEKSIIISTKSKNLHRFDELNIENLWLIGAKEKDLDMILSKSKLKYLNVYQVLAKDLSIFESLKDIKGISIEWNTKLDTLWNFKENEKLSLLEITDFSKIYDISQISDAKHLQFLSIGGGINKAMKIESIKPITKLQKLEFLSLTNLKIANNSLKPIAEIKSLKELDVSNQFETQDYAYLSAKMHSTKCKLFKAYTNCNITGVNNELIWDTMITGKRKPFLLSTKDNARIEKYSAEFEKLKNSFI